MSFLPPPPLPIITPAPSQSPPDRVMVRATPVVTTGAAGHLSTPIQPGEPPSSPTTPTTPMIPTVLASGVPMLKLSSKKVKPVIVNLSPTQITWPSLKGGKVEIKGIRELRLGQSPTDSFDGRRWLTIVYIRGGQWKVVHFIAHTDDIYTTWVRTLRELLSHASSVAIDGVHEQPERSGSGDSSPDSVSIGGADGTAEGDKSPSSPVPDNDPDLLFIRQLWPAGARRVDANTASRLCAQLGLIVRPEKAAEYEPLNIAGLRRLVGDVQKRPDLETVFKRLGGPLDKDAVRVILQDVQRDDFDDQQIGDIFERYADPATSNWTLGSVTTFLASRDNVRTPVHNLTQPLTDYFVASSHNTYLVAEQWRGASTVEGYIRVLLAGCRSVEIDVHDGDAGPVVYHGNTITSSLPVRDVCQAVKKYAFVASPYPVIISLEIRCSPENQDCLAGILVQVFGDLLVTSPLPDVDGIPSPEQLKGRILVKSKAPPRPQPQLALTVPLSSSPTHHDSTDSTTTESDSPLARIVRRLSMSAPKQKSKSVDTRVLSTKLGNLAVYTTGVKYRGFSKLIEYETTEMFSLSERTANRILREGQKADWIKHNYNHLSRVYPKAMRLGSSNYDPRPYWLAGAQLVALNYQTQDSGSLYNHALFHGGPGYVLKPAALRHKIQEEPYRYRVSVRIISAQRLPPSADLYVEATIGDTLFKTQSVAGMSAAPQWDKMMQFDLETTSSALDLTFLHLEIKSKSQSGVIAQWMNSLAMAPRGYRYLPLRDQTRAKYLFATLFIRLDIVVRSTPSLSSEQSVSSQ